MLRLATATVLAATACVAAACPGEAAPRSSVLRSYATPFPYSRCREVPVTLNGAAYMQDTCTGAVRPAGSRSSGAGGGKGIWAD